MKNKLYGSDLCPECGEILRKRKLNNPGLSIAHHYYCKNCKQVILPEELAEGRIIRVN